jgi:hypothetical protein
VALLRLVNGIGRYFIDGPGADWMPDISEVFAL